MIPEVAVMVLEAAFVALRKRVLPLWETTIAPKPRGPGALA